MQHGCEANLAQLSECVISNLLIQNIILMASHQSASSQAHIEGAIVSMVIQLPYGWICCYSLLSRVLGSHCKDCFNMDCKSSFLSFR